MDGPRAMELAALPALPGVERWDAQVDGRVCVGCRFLENRVFAGGEGPRPPLHEGRRRRRVAVDLSGITGAALIALALTARRNVARGEELVGEARGRRVREHARPHGGGRMRRRMARRAVRRLRMQEGARE